MYNDSTPIGGKVSSGIGALIAAINKFPQEWALTPCVGKKNLWPAWQKTKLDRAQLIEAIRSQKNHEGKKTRWTGVSIVTGSLSGGIMAIDFDGPAAWKKYLEFSGGQEPPLTQRWTSERTGHFQILLSVSPQKWEGLKPVKIELENGEKLELRWNQCSTLPPSIHPDTGKPYIWESEAPIAVCPDWILDLMREPGASIPAEKKLPQSPPQTSDEKSLVDLLEEEILPRLDAEEFYGSYLKLKFSGKKSLKGLCPFHKEKTPSFTVSPESCTYHCFGCGAGGGPAQFLHQIKGGSGSPTGKDFYSVVMELADRVGVQIPDRKSKTQNPEPRIQNLKLGNNTSNLNNSFTSHPRTQENVVYLESISSISDYIPDSAPIPEQNYVQKAVEALYSRSPMAAIAGQLYEFIGTHYELRPEATEKRRILDWLSTYSEFVKGKYRCNRANSASVNEVYSYMLLAVAADPNTINPDGLNTTKGVVKINPDGSHSLVPHDPKNIYTYVGCTYAPDIDATDCDRLLECLEPSQREIFLRTAAAALNLKLVRSRLTGRGVKGLLCYGEGSNGKDTLRAVLAAVFGRGMTGKSLSDFKSYDNGRKFSLAGIEGSICNWASENTAKVDLDNLQSLKQFITGDILDIERKGKDGYEYKPAAIFFANCNKLPSITGGTAAIDDRYGILSFKKTYKRDADLSQGELEADPRFKDDENFILERIAPAMLNKMLERLPLLLTEGIDYKATREAMREAQEESRHLWQFAREIGLHSNPKGKVYIGDLYKSLEDWYQENGWLTIDNSGTKSKKFWEAESPYDSPVKKSQDLYLRLRELFPKIERQMDTHDRKGHKCILGLELANSSQPSQPLCTEAVSSQLSSQLSSQPGCLDSCDETLSQSEGCYGCYESLPFTEFLQWFSKQPQSEREKMAKILTQVQQSHSPLKPESEPTVASVPEVISPGDAEKMRDIALIWWPEYRSEHLQALLTQMFGWNTPGRKYSIATIVDWLEGEDELVRERIAELIRLHG